MTLYLRTCVAPSYLTRESRVLSSEVEMMTWWLRLAFEGCRICEYLNDGRDNGLEALVLLYLFYNLLGFLLADFQLSIPICHQ
jgi:hypothetical protein